MIIEFFGFPGSGKTTICNRFVKKLNKDDQKVIRGTFDHLGTLERVVCKLFFSFLCIFINPYFYLKNIFFFLKPRKGKRMGVADFLNVTYLYSRYFMYKKSKKIVVFDQGLIQAYWSIVVFVEDEKEYNYNLLFKHIDVIVILEIDMEKNLERLFMREDKRSRIQKEEAEGMEFYFKKFLMVKEGLNELDVPYKIYLDSEKKAKKNVKKIRKKIIFN